MFKTQSDVTPPIIGIRSPLENAISLVKLSYSLNASK